MKNIICKFANLLITSVVILVIAIPTSALAEPVTTGPELGIERHVLTSGSGNVENAITLVVFHDTECPFCERLFNQTLVKLVKHYKGKVQLSVRHFPMSSIHPRAMREAQALECITEMKGDTAFWKMLRYINDTPGSLNRMHKARPSTTTAHWMWMFEGAKKIGVKKGELRACVTSGETKHYISDDITSASGFVDATPTTFFYAPGSTLPVEKIEGAMPYEDFTAVIDRLLQQ